MAKLLAIQYVDKDKNYIYEDNGSYYFQDKDKKIPLTKLQVAEMISNYWDLDLVLNVETCKLEDGTYKTTKNIPIYDWISVDLFGYGDTEFNSVINADYTFKEFCDYHNKYEENEKRNERNFMKKIKKFAFLPIQRDFSDIHKLDFDNVEFIAFEDNDDNFRKNIIKNGVPKDARADDPICGYVYANKLVFFKSFFLKGQKEYFDKFIMDNYEKVAKFYHLDNFELYEGVIPPYYQFVDANDNLLDTLVTDDYEYYKEGILILKKDL